jgi:hypothetical protein
VDADYPLLSVFLYMLWFFVFILWLFLLFTVFVDIFRSSDLSGWGKAGWSIFIIVLPLLGVLVYLIVRGGKMHERSERTAARDEAEFREYVRAAAATPSVADELHKLATLRDSGVITPAEFEREKSKLLAHT